MFQKTADMPRVGNEMDRLQKIISAVSWNIISLFLFRLPTEFFNFFTGLLLTLQGSSAACSVSTPPSPFRQAPL